MSSVAKIPEGSHKFIFTKHAKERLALRSIPLSSAESVMAYPDRTEPGKKPGTVKFVRTLNGREIQLIATLLEPQKQWLVVSAWVRGENDPNPLMWQIISFPFRASWWILRSVTGALLAKTAKNK